MTAFQRQETPKTLCFAKMLRTRKAATKTVKKGKYRMRKTAKVQRKLNTSWLNSCVGKQFPVLQLRTDFFLKSTGHWVNSFLYKKICFGY